MIQELMLNGFVVYAKEDKFFLEKIAVPIFNVTITPQIFDNYDQAIAAAYSLLEQQAKIREFTATVRYNRGLGIEYKELPIIYAENIIEANKKAQILAEQFLLNANIIEIRVRPRRKT